MRGSSSDLKLACFVAAAVGGFELAAKAPKADAWSLSPAQKKMALKKTAKGVSAALLALALPQVARSAEWKTVIVDANGEEATTGVAVKQGTVELPMRTPPLSREAVEVSRKAKAVVLLPAEGSPKGGVVFLHGFSQQPKNYETMLRAMAASGLEVVAPKTWLFDVIFEKVETVSGWWKLRAKLQSALIIDGLRSVEMLRKELGVLSFVGHSMGGAGALVVPSLLRDGKDAASIFVMSPLSDGAVKTELNPHLAGDPATYPKLFDAYGSSEPEIVLVSADQDQIVSPSSVKDVYDAAPPKRSALARIMVGSHVGYEDSFRIPIPIPFTNGAVTLFSFWDELIFGSDAIQGFFGVDYDVQKGLSIALLHRLNAAVSGTTADLADKVVFDTPVEDWEAVYKLTSHSPLLKRVLTLQ
ncbi:hypothetical protein CTAYLR_006248 [Chrysophaeum taylorii]|uniref:Chlorophyllase n=1 Tax=Chrysophaeum taylorii TaxID=2483200 RepID=A0AAD7XMP2_9STRA|nr:hypothetical protein CTAYLR_006248 [Chrysophaeum taylorii]